MPILTQSKWQKVGGLDYEKLKLYLSNTHRTERRDKYTVRYAPVLQS